MTKTELEKIKQQLVEIKFMVVQIAGLEYATYEMGRESALKDHWAWREQLDAQLDDISKELEKFQCNCSQKGIIIKLGKLYKTRDGKQVLIHNTKGNINFPFFSGIVKEDEMAFTWHLNGKALPYYPDAAYSSLDIVAEWEE